MIEITRRAVELLPKLETRDVLMDLEACHCNGCALDLKGLLGANDQDFIHDVLGIRRHINRRTGKLEDAFSPRYEATNHEGESI
jgi:hypothetical protein